ncbi:MULTISPECIES: hypothetical protein [Flavobacteriaceae]|jgi:predicted RNA-binding Zn-ribbon protein involved in translation (DUF1610 family)|uniref:Uncharacterized protein n=1 Tax=Nonlabens dokdonensis TaxID=328515 RepID=A0A1Z8ASM9_9FLAO|nr:MULTISPECIES: hypothetical protein [Flavobacteriaceae]MAM23260.1 hypothetical protein [Croceibacter sp.]MBW4971296.1 hypothetical protein [Croceibacter atlanticus]MCD9620390.1 hypothetical protein [Tenacibaculum maritimum]MCD9626687.1 hypothetical protein [Tenacibaculum maritimum]MCD9629084.1 hypothetical protein [Tenacibaculum maritimum]
MKRNNNPKNLAQNRIDYIVFHNTDAANDILFDYGFEKIDNQQHLSQAVKELVKNKGRKVIKDLLEIHPDKAAILQVNTVENSKCAACGENAVVHTERSRSTKAENYCKSCGHSNYAGSGDEDSFLDQFNSYDDKALEKYYQDIVKRSNEDLEDKNLAQEVQMVWNELRKRKESKPESKPEVAAEKPKGIHITKDEMLLFGVVFIAGVLVGASIKFDLKNGK